MLNMLITTMIAGTLMAVSVFGQNNPPCPKPCPQPMPPTQVCPSNPCCPAWPTPVLNAAYGYPARLLTRCPWDVYMDASFIYWQASQENMELGIVNATAPIAPLITVVTGTFSSVSGNYANMDFNFKPGFKVGLGGYFNHDNWDLHAEYTWFEGTNRKTANGLIIPVWGFPETRDFYGSVSERWRLKMDLVDLTLGRSHYVGTKFIAHPYFGARAAWIRQKLQIQSVNNGNLGAGIANQSTIKANTMSWAVGPELGVDTRWNLGAGFRLYGNGEADLLFTDYRQGNYNETNTRGGGIVSPIAIHQSNLHTLRTHLDLELGFGWGGYLNCNNWHLDFSAGYGFQVFFDQNMFRAYSDFNGSAPNGNLYVQGATGTLQLDF